MNLPPLCTGVTSVYEDKRAQDGALGDANKYGQFSEYFNVLPSLCPAQQWTCTLNAMLIDNSFPPGHTVTHTGKVPLSVVAEVALCLT